MLLGYHNRSCSEFISFEQALLFLSKTSTTDLNFYQAWIKKILPEILYYNRVKVWTFSLVLFLPISYFYINAW